MRALWLAALAAFAVLATAGSARADTSQCTTSGPHICVATSDTPNQVSVATAASQTYIQYQTTITNRDTSTVTHLGLQDVLPAGTTLKSASPAACTAASGGVTCALGSLARGASVTVVVTVAGPAQAGTIANHVTASFDEGPSDNPGNDPKQDTLTAVETTDVSATPGVAESWVPGGVEARLSTDPTGTDVATKSQTQVAGVTIQAPPVGAIARLHTNQPGAFTCPKGQVCRSGGWVHAEALVDGVPGIFDPPLRFFLRWDASLVPKQQSVKNLVVFYTPQLGGPVQVISARCSASVGPPCLTDVTEQPDGDFTAVLVQDHNGYMR